MPTPKPNKKDTIEVSTHLVSMFDPFNTKKAPEGLVNFTTCQQTTEDIEINMISCIDYGEDMLKKFLS